MEKKLAESTDNEEDNPTPYGDEIVFHVAKPMLDALRDEWEGPFLLKFIESGDHYELWLQDYDGG